MFSVVRLPLFEVILKVNYGSKLCSCSVIGDSAYLYHSCRMFTQKSCFKTISVAEFINEENKKNCMARLQKISVPSFVKKKPLKKAAVLIPLCTQNNEISLLFTLRRRDLKRHRGQVSFPGGVQDPEDVSLCETALRETEEELRICRNFIDVWGHGNPIIGVEFSVLPVLGFIGDINEISMKPNPDEVELAFTVPLSHFCNKDNCKFTKFRNKNENIYIMPVYPHTPYRIWGMTAVMIHLILSALLPNDYNHKLHT
ncbi:mitochondrial coenzyme A diphosphatase NUDT8 [Lycorma delicatula]|uniref:mitochondrial coenzyme A diphosphatase NUDT8 n=1 Tax=Lycorma delicatula TaxID=130591 RepID=UPI003F514052